MFSIWVDVLSRQKQHLFEIFIYLYIENAKSEWSQKFMDTVKSNEGAHKPLRSHEYQILYLSEGLIFAFQQPTIE